MRYRRLRNDMNEICKILTGRYDLMQPQLEVARAITSKELITTSENISLKGIVKVWNSLPNRVITANSLNQFKARLDKYWAYKMVYDYRDRLTRNKTV